MDCIIYVAKTKTLISFAATAKLICVFGFVYAKSRFSHVAAQNKYDYTYLGMQIPWSGSHIIIQTGVSGGQSECLTQLLVVPKIY